MLVSYLPSALFPQCEIIEIDSCGSLKDFGQVGNPRQLIISNCSGLVEGSQIAHIKDVTISQCDNVC